MGKRSASAVWKYFKMFLDRLETGKCNICSQEIRRGTLGATSEKNFNQIFMEASKIKKQKCTFTSRKGAVERNKKREKIFKK